MKLLFYKDPRGNFGDSLNTWIWDRLLPGWGNMDDDVTLLGVGTILNETWLAPLRDKRLLVLGSGVGYGLGPPKLPLSEGWDFRAVRGPRSARILGLPMSKALVDPAVMIPDFAEFEDIATSGPPVFVPHHGTVARHDWDAACRQAGLRYVSPRGEARGVIRQIAAAPLVLAEAMHAAIIADAFRIPWLPVRIGPQFNAEKWQDWGESLGMDLTIPHMFPLIEALYTATALPRGRFMMERMSLVRRLRHQMSKEPHLSNGEILERKKELFGQVLKETAEAYCG